MPTQPIQPVQAPLFPKTAKEDPYCKGCDYRELPANGGFCYMFAKKLPFAFKVHTHTGEHSLLIKYIVRKKSGK